MLFCSEAQEPSWGLWMLYANSSFEDQPQGTHRHAPVPGLAPGGVPGLADSCEVFESLFVWSLSQILNSLEALYIPSVWSTLFSLLPPQSNPK